VAVMERAEVVREVVAEHAEVARVNVMRWSHETWVTVSAWTTKTAIRTKALVLSMTTPPRAVGEPDEDLRACPALCASLRRYNAETRARPQ
jgi:hypothetical protein